LTHYQRVTDRQTDTPPIAKVALCHSSKNREKFEFLINISPKGQIPLSNFYKIKGGGGCPSFVTSRQISPLSLLKCGLTAPKIAEIGNYGRPLSVA